MKKCYPEIFPYFFFTQNHPLPDSTMITQPQPNPNLNCTPVYSMYNIYIKVFYDRYANTFVSHCISIGLERFRQPRLHCFYSTTMCTFKARTMPDRRQFLPQLAAKLALCADHAIRIDRALLAQNCARQEFSMCFWFWSVGPEALCNDNWSLLNS